MRRFADGREAKEFLIGKLLSQARCEGLELSDTERKMLYFSETAWTLPDALEVNEKFEREYDGAKYEQKIAGLAKRYSIAAREKEPEEFASWKKAIQTLLKEDHYLLVLIHLPQQATTNVSNRVKLVATALAIVCAIIVAMLLFSR